MNCLAANLLIPELASSAIQFDDLSICRIICKAGGTSHAQRNVHVSRLINGNVISIVIACTTEHFYPEHLAKLVGFHHKNVGSTDIFLERIKGPIRVPRNEMMTRSVPNHIPRPCM
jgi:hypothetical protein